MCDGKGSTKTGIRKGGKWGLDRWKKREMKGGDARSERRVLKIYMSDVLKRRQYELNNDIDELEQEEG